MPRHILIKSSFPIKKKLHKFKQNKIHKTSTTKKIRLIIFSNVCGIIQLK